PQEFRCIWKIRMAWTEAPYSRFQSAREKPAEMNLPRATSLLIVSVFLSGGVPAQNQSSAASSTATVKPEDLLQSPVGENWTSYNGDYTGRRYSVLHQIDTGNVHKLRAAWVFHPGNSQNLETTPVVIRGVMFITSANDVFAVDARTGRQLWHYHRPISSGLL